MKRLIAIVVLVIGVMGTSAPAFASTGTGAEDSALFYRNNRMCIRFNLWGLTSTDPTICLPLL